MSDGRVSVDYAVVTQLVSTMETLSTSATNLLNNLDGLQGDLRANWESVESKFLFEGDRYNEFISNINIIKTDIDSVSQWCTETMTAFTATQNTNADNISAAMNGF